ncbi:MAG: stage II sporulation protein M [Calditrichaeota bacterium]|nr:stage II sporulation protein M [Calditrichota bacterium]
MIQAIRDLFDLINYTYFFLSAVLFLGGIYVAPNVVEKNIGFLLKYPRWMRRVMERYFTRKYPFLVLFTIIFLLNNLSLFTSFLSGFILIGPPIAAFLTGLNVAIVSYDMMGWRGIWQILVNPVAWLEFPAAWISFAMGFRLAEAFWLHHSWATVQEQFWILLPVYGKYVMVLLFIAALLESGLIVLAERMNDEEED